MRGISKERLALLLSNIPSGSFITGNAQGNLKIMFKGEFYGVIDVNDKAFHPAEVKEVK